MAKIKCFFLKVFCDGVLVMIVTMTLMMKITWLSTLNAQNKRNQYYSVNYEKDNTQREDKITLLQVPSSKVQVPVWSL